MSGWEWPSEDERELARGGYTLDDPKHPDYYDTVTAFVDAERKREKEEGPMSEVAVAEPVTLFRTDEPEQVIANATLTADKLAAVIRNKRLSVSISGREHVRVEGWTLLGTMLGVFPIVVWTRKLEDGWEARVEARTRAGELVGAAEAECLVSESNWSNRDDYAVRSMAQTRATSKALRQPLGFVMSLAGFEATPAEEMPSEASPFREPDLARDKRQVRAILAKLKKAEAPGFDQDAVDAALELHYGTKKISELNAKDTADLLQRLLEKEKEFGV